MERKRLWCFKLLLYFLEVFIRSLQVARLVEALSAEAKPAVEASGSKKKRTHSETEAELEPEPAASVGAAETKDDELSDGDEDVGPQLPVVKKPKRRMQVVIPFTYLRCSIGV